MVYTIVISKRSHYHHHVNNAGSGYSVTTGLMVREVGSMMEKPRTSPRNHPVSLWFSGHPSQAERPRKVSPLSPATTSREAGSLDKDMYYSNAAGKKPNRPVRAINVTRSGFITVLYYIATEDLIALRLIALGHSLWRHS